MNYQPRPLSPIIKPIVHSKCILTLEPIIGSPYTGIEQKRISITTGTNNMNSQTTPTNLLNIKTPLIEKSVNSTYGTISFTSK